jgi:hypothetical protein
VFKRLGPIFLVVGSAASDVLGGNLFGFLVSRTLEVE